MTEVELIRDTLIVRVRGMDRLWALKSRLDIPLSHVVGAEGELVFWDVHDPERTVVIRLRDERYARLVIEVDDPFATAEAIRKALGEDHNSLGARR